MIGLEQTSASESLFEFKFPLRMVLVVGNERTGISDEVLAIMDKVVEVPRYSNI